MKKIILRTLCGLIIIFLLFAGYFLYIKKQDNYAAIADNFYSSSYDTSRPILLPSLFINGERFYIKMATDNGDTLLAYGDSGGGISMFNPFKTDKGGLAQKIRSGIFKGLMPMHYVLFSDIVHDKRIPPPVQLRDKILHTPFARVTASMLLVPPKDDELKFINSMMDFDIFLGQNFFMGKAWTIDYKTQQIWVNTPIAIADALKPGVQKVGIKKNANGVPLYGHASMVIEVNGELIEVLFDTGATITLSDEGKKEFNTTLKSLGGSFIARSIFEKWHHDHPEWKFYPHADGKNDVIEVPLVKIGGHEVGPVLFASRPDAVWSQDMINTMDKVVKGAIGGSALKYLKVTIDYNSELLKVE